MRRTWQKTQSKRMSPGHFMKPPMRVTTIMPTYTPAATRRRALVMFRYCLLKPRRKLRHACASTAGKGAEIMMRAMLRPYAGATPSFAGRV